MASSRMLTQLLRIDNIAYALRPVSNFDQVIESYHSFVTSEIKTVILINCGAVRWIVLLRNYCSSNSTNTYVFFPNNIRCTISPKCSI